MFNAEEELKINLRAIFGRNRGHLGFVSRDHRKIITLNSPCVGTCISRIIKAVQVYTSTMFLPICYNVGIGTTSWLLHMFGYNDGHFEYYSVFLGGHQLKYFLLSPDMVKHRNGQNKIIFLLENAIKLCSILAIVGENGGHFEFWSCEHSRTLL